MHIYIYIWFFVYIYIYICNKPAVFKLSPQKMFSDFCFSDFIWNQSLLLSFLYHIHMYMHRFLDNNQIKTLPLGVFKSLTSLSTLWVYHIFTYYVAMCINQYSDMYIKCTWWSDFWQVQWHNGVCKDSPLYLSL